MKTYNEIVMNNVVNSSEDLRTLPNSSEGFRSVPNTSEGFGSVQNTSKRTHGVGRGKKYTGADVPEEELMDENFPLVMEDVYALFERQGERRSARMIAEYCKTGELVCYYDSDDTRWHFTAESVQSKIDKIKSLNARKSKEAPTDAPMNTSEEFRTTEKTPEETPAEAPRNDERIKELEDSVFNLEIDKRAKEQVINHLKDQVRADRTEFTEKLVTYTRLVGQLETQLKQLEAPKEDRTAAANVHDAEFSEARSERGESPPTKEPEGSETRGSTSTVSQEYAKPDPYQPMNLSSPEGYEANQPRTPAQPTDTVQRR